MNTKFTFFISLIITVLSCNTKKNEDKTPIAQVYDQYLYKEDIANIFTEKISPEDSIEKIKSFIDSWAKKQLLKKKAEVNLTKEQLDVNQQLEEYRASLLIHKYKEKFTNQKLDTTIKDAEIDLYYNQHKEEFLLTQDVVKALFIKVALNAPNINDLKSKCKSDKEPDKKYVLDYCVKYSGKYDDFGGEWINFSDLKNKIPVQVNSENNRFIEATDKEFLYLVKIVDSKTKGTASPAIFVKENIKSILLNKRKIDLIKDLENDLYQDAVLKNDLKIFVK